MLRENAIVVRTEQDIEAACRRLDDRAREMLENFEDEIDCDECEELIRLKHEQLDGFDL